MKEHPIDLDVDSLTMLDQLRKTRPEVVAVGMSSIYPFPSIGRLRVDYDLSGLGASEYERGLKLVLAAAAANQS